MPFRKINAKEIVDEKVKTDPEFKRYYGVLKDTAKITSMNQKDLDELVSSLCSLGLSLEETCKEISKIRLLNKNK